ncbi:MAG: YkgJ family cysteine cluster protein [Candidatus Acetothermia bacterium]
MKMTPIGISISWEEYNSLSADSPLLKDVIQLAERLEPDWLIDRPVPTLDQPVGSMHEVCRNCFNCCFFTAPLKLSDPPDLPKGIPSEGYFRTCQSTFIRANKNHLRFFSKSDHVLVSFACIFLSSSGLCTIYGNRFYICSKFPQVGIRNCPKKNQDSVDTLIVN